MSGRERAGETRTGRAPTSVGALLAALLVAACSEADAVPAARRAPTPAVGSGKESGKPLGEDAGMRRLLADLGSGRSTAREPALLVLVGAGDSARLAAEEALGLDQVLLRRGGARALEKLADARSVPALAAALARRDPLDEDVLIRTLSRIGTSEAGKALVAAAGGADPRRAILAGTALADFAGPLDVGALRAAATSGKSAFHVREAALLALGGHASAEDRATFEAASRDSAAPIRVASVRGLFSFAPVAAADLRRLLREDPEAMVRRAAAKEALHVRDASVVAELLAAAQEFDEDVATDAVETLAKRDEPAAFEALLEVVRDDSRTPHLRGTAARRAAAKDREKTLAMLKRESAIFDMESRAYCDELIATEAKR